MAYVSGFEWDIFISYPMEAEAWARRFELDLRKLEGTQLPEAIDPQVYFAGKDWKLANTSDDMLEAARNSALFVAILTRDSLSENHKRFLTEEMESFQKSGPVKGRFCPILLHPIDPSQLREAMPVGKPQAFWSTNLTFFYDEGDNIPLWLKPDSEPKPGEYSRRVLRVAHRLRELLDNLRASRSDEARINRQGPFAGKTVFLARKDTETAIEKEWLTVRSTLLSDGAIVVPDAESDKVDAETDRKLLRDADLFVQLFYALDRLEDAKTQLQLAEAESRARQGKKPLPILRWRKRHFSAQAEANYVGNLPEEDQKFCETGQTGTLEEFKLAVRDGIPEPSKPLLPLPPEQPYLYITADKSDLDLAMKLQARAVQGDRTVTDIMTRDETKQREDFVNGLMQASAVVFLYGKAQPTFIEAWFREFIRNAGLAKLLPKFRNRKWLYLAPPEKGQGAELMRPFELRVEGSHEEFTLEGIEKICAELCSGPR